MQSKKISNDQELIQSDSIYVFSYFPFGFEGRIWDLIVSVPDHCLSFYFSSFGTKLELRLGVILFSAIHVLPKTFGDDHKSCRSTIFKSTERGKLCALVVCDPPSLL